MTNTINRINNLVDYYKAQLNIKPKKKILKKKEIEKLEIQQKLNRPCIFPGCDQKITANRGSSFCFDHKFFDTRRKILVSWGYSNEEAEFYSRVKNIPAFLKLLKRKKERCES